MGNDSILVIDVGSGTQDILVYQVGKNVENCPKLVMPSRTQIVASQIRFATDQGKDIFLYGHLMGGGSNAVALKKHRAAGFKVYATENVALTFHDNLELVKKMGVLICEEAPAGAEAIWLGDVDEASIKQALAAFGQEMPKKFAVAVQDHGFNTTGSNRSLRFQLWEEFVLSGGLLKTLVFDGEIPKVYTRMQAVRDCLEDSVLADTGTAALLGIIADPEVQAHLDKGIVAVNIGNSHTLAAAIRGSRVYGIFEQHTGFLDLAALKALILRFQAAELTNEEIFNQGGHGATLHPDMSPGWEFVVVTGPRRAMAKPLGWYEAAPYGDMMLTGCFGMLRGMGLIEARCTMHNS